MSVPVLSHKEQSRSLSVMKKKQKKKVHKNVLSVPEDKKLSCSTIEKAKLPMITEILNKLLPSARLEIRKTQTKKQEHSSTENSASSLTSESHMKRKQLLIGINCVSKGIKTDAVACVLIADDVQPKLLVSHLIALCRLKNIPHVYMPNLRVLTKKTLGFSCIVLGFKKNHTDFTEAVNFIAQATGNSDSLLKVMENLQNEIVEVPFKVNSKAANNGTDKIKFTYLLRKSNLKRVFIPEESNESMETEKSNMEFIPVSSVDKDSMIKESEILAFSKTKSGNFLNNMLMRSNKSSEKKQYKKSEMSKPWSIDKRGEKNCIKYSPAKVMRMESNTNRQKKKFKKMRRKI